MIELLNGLSVIFVFLLIVFGLPALLIFAVFGRKEYTWSDAIHDVFLRFHPTEFIQLRDREIQVNAFRLDWRWMLR